MPYHNLGTVTTNKEYWERYVDYWKTKVDDSNQNRIKDRTMSDDLVGKWYDTLHVIGSETFLDFGCGFCRLYPFYSAHNGTPGRYIGVDIAESPLLLAHERYPELEVGKNLFSYDGVNIPFEDESFDKIMCFGVFDACDQTQILTELLRVTTVDGELLITGKNDLYQADDDEAYIAEVNARKKGHPNGFTDVNLLKKLLKDLGSIIIDEFYFLRRGDFANSSFEKDQPQRFYEWCFRIKKVKKFDMGCSDINKVVIHERYSKSFFERGE